MTQRLRVAIVYDRVFPASFGGAERWFHTLASALVQHDADVTFLTSEHWAPGAPPHIDGVRVIPLCGAGDVWSGSQRASGPVANFGLAVLGHLARHGDAYDVIHTTAMAPAAAMACVAAGTARRLPVVIDWWEIWTRETWQAYLGQTSGAAAAVALRALARSPHWPLVYSRLHQRRLGELRGQNDATLLRGVLAHRAVYSRPLPSDPYVLLVSRLIPEKQTTALMPALALARAKRPDLRAVVVGSGPEADALSTAIARSGVAEAVTVVQGIPDDALEALMRRALCVVSLSRREGYGLVIAEAMRLGVPALVLDHPDSAAPELVVPGENGFLLSGIGPQELASAILNVHDAGIALRSRTLAWSQRHDHELSIAASLPQLLEIYQRAQGKGSEPWWRRRRP